MIKESLEKVGTIIITLFWLVAAPLASGAEQPPVYIGLDAEFGHKTSSSAQAVRHGMEIAIDEINRAGGVLHGRKLELIVTDNRSIPAIGIDNLKALAAKPELVGVFGAKFSPVLLEWVPLSHELGLPVFATWSSANAITDHNLKPSWSFRLSLKDDWAAQTLIRFAKEARGARRIGLLLPNSGWGRSNQAAIRKTAPDFRIAIAGERWYNGGEKSLLALYQELRQSGAEAIVMVANEAEGATLVKEVAALPEAEKLPLISHWGVTGGDFSKLAGDALNRVDFSVVQTYSFIGAKTPAARRVLAALKERYGIENAEKLESPVGVAHAYDLTHLLARAIDKAGSTNRAKIRDALEHLGPYDGLVRRYNRPFSAERHDALSPEQVFMARYNADGTLIPLAWNRKQR